MNARMIKKVALVSMICASANAFADMTIQNNTGYVAELSGLVQTHASTNPVPQNKTSQLMDLNNANDQQ